MSRVAGSVRITGGQFARRSVPVPADARPTEGRVREALFSIWAPRLAGARFLDLFAGSGAVGLEAAGRGADLVVAVEGQPKTAAALKGTVQRLGAPVEVRSARLPAGLAAALRGLGAFDLVYVDPPYGWGEYAALLRLLPGHVVPGGEVAIEMSMRSSAPETPPEMERGEERRYGETALRFYVRR